MTQIIIIAAAAFATAQIAHEVNRAHCIAIGDTSQLPWDDAPDWQRDTVLKGVEFHVQNPDADASASHESWMAQKVAEGWVYGEVKDPDKKTHPCMVAFADLPLAQQEKDILFKSVVATAYPLLAAGDVRMSGQHEDIVAASAEISALKEQLADLTAKLEAAEKKAKAAKLSHGEKAAKPRKIGPIAEGKSLSADDLRAAIAGAEKIEILFGDGKQESGPAPILVEGDAWREHAMGLMLTEPVTVHGPAVGSQPYHIAGAALLLDGKQVAWCQRPDPLSVGAGQKYGLSNDIFF